MNIDRETLRQYAIWSTGINIIFFVAIVLLKYGVV